MSLDSEPPAMDGLTLRDAAIRELQFSQRLQIKSILERPDKGTGLMGQKVRIGGWVKIGRDKGAFAFLEVNDGSCPGNLQVILKAHVYNYKLSDVISTGTCVHLEGSLKCSEQSIELDVERVIDVGSVDASKYPLSKPDLTLEFLRDFVHLRPRTNTISAVARIRNALAYATHTFFQNHGFLYVHTPIISTSNCEGVGEMFQVTTLINDAEKAAKDLKDNPLVQDDIISAEILLQEKSEALNRLKAAEANYKEIVAAVAELNKAMESLSKLYKRGKLAERLKHGGGDLSKKEDGTIDYADDFFARQAFLTVSGQLQVETYACALSSVYTFGPTFRAENSYTSRHLSEFWMVEPEIAFADIHDDMNCAEAYVKFLCQWLLDHCYDDMEFMARNDTTAIQRLEMVAKSSFHRITYTEAVAILREASKIWRFENKVEWGIDLALEHERYLTEEQFKSPVIVYDYPKATKAFYMKVNEDNRTVASMDVLVPRVGKLIGGSQREDKYEVLKERIMEMGLPIEPYKWYLDLRSYGTVKHSGFGLGFERMVLYATGLDNIRDVIPFPRYPGTAEL
ncbi:Asparagine--tRNA ligase, cytoplasmic 1 [Castilleja foliolosa]|uniref:asparagine--tRNA ligase n=1 Tax=Castilleja foliolosa TaxID=1961234 RepID=A0ABD3DBX5_9LAMI